jgi:carbohydrate-binding DOMON domain-containing protein
VVHHLGSTAISVLNLKQVQTVDAAQTNLSKTTQDTEQDDTARVSQLSPECGHFNKARPGFCRLTDWQESDPLTAATAGSKTQL